MRVELIEKTRWVRGMMVRTWGWERRRIQCGRATRTWGNIWVWGVGWGRFAIWYIGKVIGVAIVIISIILVIKNMNQAVHSQRN
jgi:hypothetical protein